jgi:hypothetical protein
MRPKIADNRMPRRASGRPVLLLAGIAVIVTMLLSACGGGASSDPQPSASLSGNWQFTMSPPPDGSFTGGLQGGFLLQNKGTVSGQTVYSVSLPNSQTGPCNSGSATITGTVSGQTVTLTAVAATQTFTFTGTLSANGTTMAGTYTSTAGTTSNGSACGTAQTALQWSALSVPPITGAIEGSFHSTGGIAGLANQDFAVTGSLTQSENIGASNATVTGSLTFLDPITNLSVYPCFAQASVNGQISGNSVMLQVIGIDGSNLGQIGEPPGSEFLGATGLNPVTYDSVQGGYILHGIGPSYLVASKTCGGSPSSTTTAGDFGNICLSIGSGTACQRPITLIPSVLTFPAQALGTPASTQTISLANNSASTLSGLTLNFVNNGDNTFGGQSNFNQLPSFTEQDTCAPSPGASFALAPGQSCSINVTFSPQESCPWLPFGVPPSISGAAPEWCPLPQTALVTVTVPNSNPSSPDSDNNFATAVTGIGLSAIQPSVRELDFGAQEALNPPEASVPQTLSFTNNSGSPVQILGRALCHNPPKGQNTLPHPLLATSAVAGLQVVSNGSGSLPITPNGSTINYNCDSDSGTALPNFQISNDTCTGNLLASQASCSIQATYAPQPNTNVGNGLDYFLELNTVQCSSSVSSDCEIDSGRFPVELRANSTSPLRMTPSAGLDFGNQAQGKTSAPLMITLLNDPNLETTQTVTFVGKIAVSGNYSETDDCPISLAPGTSCTLTVTFKPSTVGFLPGSLTINYSPEPLGLPQVVYLRGTGQ